MELCVNIRIVKPGRGGGGGDGGVGGDGGDVPNKKVHKDSFLAYLWVKVI